MSWNLLGDTNLQANPELYEKCHPKALPWSHRLPPILETIRRLDSDVVALQEVEYFDRDLAEPLKRDCGLDGVYKQRTGGQEDGVALLWRTTRLSLLHVEPLEYANALTEGVTDPTQDALLRKHNVGLVGVFLDLIAQREVVVATTHLLFNPKRGIVKMRQLQHLLQRVDAARMATFDSAAAPTQPASAPADGAHASAAAALFSPTPTPAASGTPGSRRACIILGDFNMTPSSLLHAFVRGVRLVAANHTEGDWDGHEAERRARGRYHPPPWQQECYHHATDGSRAMVMHEGHALPAPSGHALPPAPSWHVPQVDATHPLAGELLSAYGHSRGEPEATTFHKRFMGTVDFIWYTAQHLAVRTVLPTPSRRELAARHSLPDRTMPSDHVPIACDLAWRTGASGPPGVVPPPQQQPQHQVQDAASMPPVAVVPVVDVQ